MVIDHRRIRGVQPQRRIELVQRLFIHAVDPQRQPRHQMHVPVIPRRLQQVLNAMPRALFFTAAQQHVHAIQIRLHRRRIALQRLIKRPPRLQHMHLPAQPMPRILQMRNPQPGPPRRIIRIALHHALKQLARAVQFVAAPRARHERAQQRPRLQILLRNCLPQRSARSSALARPSAARQTHAARQTPRRRSPSAPRSNRSVATLIAPPVRTLCPRNIQQLPVQIEPFVRPQKASRQHELHHQLPPHAQRIQLPRRHIHQRTRRPHHQRRHLRQPRRQRIRQRIPIKRASRLASTPGSRTAAPRYSCPLDAVARRAIAKPLRQHRQNARRPLLFLRRLHVQPLLHRPC